MDFKKLSKVADSLSNPKKEVILDTDNFEVVQNTNPLNRIETRCKIKDSKSDSEVLKSLSKLDRSSKREALSKLTDSQRRRVLKLLNRNKQSKKVTDSGFSERLNMLLLDNLLSNFVYSPTEYSKQNLIEFLNSIKETIDSKYYDLIKNATEDVKVLLDNPDVDAFISNLESAGIESELKDNLEFLRNSSNTEEFDLGDEDLMELSEDVNDDIDASIYNDMSLDALTSTYDSTIKRFVDRGFRVEDVKKAYGEIWNKTFNTKIYESVVSKVNDSLMNTVGLKVEEIISDRKIIDKTASDILNKLIENTEDEEHEVSILELLNEALSEFAEGDNTKLQALSEMSLEETEEDAVEETEEDAVEETDEDAVEETDEDDTEEIDEDDTELKDSVELAKAVLTNKCTRKLVDRLKHKVKSLSKYNFISDADEFIGSEPFETADVISVPLTRDEYLSATPAIPDYLPNLVDLISNSECPVVEYWTDVDNEPCIVVNNAYKYYSLIPKNELIEILNNSKKEDWRHIINTNCKPVGDVLRAAALTDNLSVIDNKFYKQHLTDNCWYFVGEPKCLQGLNIPKGSRLKIANGLISDTSNSIDLFGQKYIIL